MTKYNPQKIEKKWQKYWEAKGFYVADEKSGKPKYYQLETFPYPSAAGLHVGHPKGYIAEDILARFNRMNDYEVLYTMGWDAFGLPTENYAIKIGKSPKEVAEANIKNFKRQIKMFGLSYDWTREINTSSQEYYRWTQWLFIQLFKAGMAYQKLAKVNWCPQDQTVLANEQVVDGKCERCGETVNQKEMKQWFFKITEYAERLLSDLKGLDWPGATIKRQEDWIGKSEGALIKFRVSSGIFTYSKDIEVFTTRPDTLFGATYIVLASEHKIVGELKNAIQNWPEVEKYIEQTRRKTELQRKEEAKEKTGIKLVGVTVINPATKEEIPVWVADYVLGDYGTGATMAVPAHDQRDYKFAEKFNLPVRMVICPNYPEKTCPVLDRAHEGDGHLVGSGKFDGMTSEKAKWEITKLVGGEKRTQYKLRDWSVSRQRYWGTPIPMIYCDQCGTVPVLEEDLPVRLPDLKDYRPKGIPPLAGSEKFLKTKCPKCKSAAKRDPETLDTFVDSSWYYLRYTDSGSDKWFASPERLKFWMPVDLYVIGAEHTVLHLLYSRFITKFLHDKGYLNFQEPFLKLRHVGLIRGSDGQKMSKSKGNVVNPDEVVEKYGVDTMRLYEMFMGPFEDSQPWDTKGLVGVFRFLNRVWNFIKKPEEPKVSDKEVEKALHKSIKGIGDDIKELKFNTGVSELMKLLNAIEDKWLTTRQYEIFLKLLTPFAPHLAEELWQSVLGHKTSVHLEMWPEYDEALLVEETVDLLVQINGKTREVLKVPRGLEEEKIKEAALNLEKIKRHLEGKSTKKTVFIFDRLINFIV